MINMGVDEIDKCAENGKYIGAKITLIKILK